jgi:hypothetical protein
VTLVVPVVSGFSPTAMLPMNCAHAPPGQSAFAVHVALLFEPLKQRFVPEIAAGAGQSRVSPALLVLTHTVP